MHATIGTFRRAAAGWVLAAFVAAGLFGAGLSLALPRGLMAPECPMRGHARSACPMSGADRFASWQSVARWAPEKGARGIIPAAPALSSPLPRRPAAGPVSHGMPATARAAGPPPNDFARLVSEGVIQPTVYG